MKNFRRILLCLLALLFSLVLVSVFKPEFLLQTKLINIFENESLNNFLLLIDIAITISLFFIQDIEVKQSTIMEFRTSNATFIPGMDNCVNVLPWVYQLLRPGEIALLEPYYFIQAYQEPQARCALFIPIEATVNTKIDGTSVILSNLELGYLSNNKDIEKFPLSEAFPNDFLTVEKIYQSGSKIFVCFSFLLNEYSNSAIQNKVIIIKFFEQFTNINGQSIKRKVQLKILNSEYGLQFLGQS